MSKKIEKWKREDYDKMSKETLIQIMVDKDDYIEELTTPPTEQELCETLSKWVKENITDIWSYKVYYDTEGFHYYNKCDFEEYLVEYERIDKAITLSVFLPPHLVEMIGKFYKGKVKE